MGLSILASLGNKGPSHKGYKIRCLQMTNMPSRKFPKRDSGSRLSKTGVNLHEIIGIRLNDTSKQGLMCEHVGKHAKMQRKQNERHKARKTSITWHGSKKGYASSKPTLQGCVLTSSYTQTSHK